VAVATATRDGYLFLTDTMGRASANDQWWHFHHDERNTGLYGFDSRPPATVDDLSASAGPSRGAVTASWHEVGDDWWAGRAKRIDVRWSTQPISDAGFSQAHTVATGGPAVSGATEHVRLSHLPQGRRVYIAERGIDDVGNTALIARANAIVPGSCADRLVPTVRFAHGGIAASRRGVRLRGTASERGCVAGRVRAVRVAVARLGNHRCRFLSSRGHAGAPRSCRRPGYLAARGTASWRFALRARLAPGRYLVLAQAIDAAHHHRSRVAVRTVRVR
jgi:hypothetical protein